MTAHQITAELDALQARFAARTAGGLKAQAAALPHDISERLRVGRERALAHARQHQLQAFAGSVVVARSSGGAAVLGGPSPWWLKLASGFPLAVLMVGLVVITQWNNRSQVLAAAEIDMQLLSDELPPNAYSDPGFAEFLRAPPQ